MKCSEVVEERWWRWYSGEELDGEGRVEMRGRRPIDGGEYGWCGSEIG